MHVAWQSGGVGGGSGTSTGARLEILWARVDAFFARVQERHGAQMDCSAGCADCCHVELLVTGVEAQAVRRAAAGLEVVLRDRLRRRARGRTRGRCAALEDDGRCAVYAGRPLACRIHGLPVRTTGRRGLPVVDACERNFRVRGPQSVEPSAVLDQAEVTTALAEAEAEDAAAAGRLAGELWALRDVLAE